MPIFTANMHGRCPHCLSTVVFIGQHTKQVPEGLNFDASRQQAMLHVVSCPHCYKLIMSIVLGIYVNQGSGIRFEQLEEALLWPPHSARPPVANEVPVTIAVDYNEAARVLELSPKASAALSRRCLQAVLRDAGSANQRDLSQQIDAVIPRLPTYLAESIDAIRNIGNFAAHPAKDRASGEIIEVEPGEAEWNLDVLDQLFDFYYVQPAKIKARRAALDAKLAAAGKPPMK